MRTLIVFLLGLAAVSAGPKNGQRIVGGSTTTISQYPEMVSLLFSFSSANHRQSCGGTILNSRSILTAAHCTIGDAPSRWRSRVGSTNANSGGTVLNTQQIINHPNYNRFNFDNDVSIIRTASNIPLGTNVRAGRIAGSNYNLQDNQVVWATGWGTTSQGGQLSETLRHVQIWAINQGICRQRYAAVGNTITDNMLCSGWLDVGGRDQCQGDSGGPLFHNGVVVGVCSWGRGCAQAQFPGVNARVSRFTNWISQNSYGDAPARWRARVGSTNGNSGGTVLDTQQIINHPDYDRTIFDNDVSIIHTITVIPFGSDVSAGRFAGPNYNLADNEVVWATGWGATWQGGWGSEQLRHVQIYSINQEICRQRYAAAGNTVTDNMLCSGVLDVGGRDQCQGDSGGPLFHNGVVVGVCSWCRGCAQANFPGVNARVSRFTNWISQNA